MLKPEAAEAAEVLVAAVEPVAVQDLEQELVQVAVQVLATVQVAVLTEIQVEAEGLQATEVLLRMLLLTLPLVPHQ
jgi:hypothetical protein